MFLVVAGLAERDKGQPVVKAVLLFFHNFGFLYFLLDAKLTKTLFNTKKTRFVFTSSTKPQNGKESCHAKSSAYLLRISRALL